MVVTSLTNDKLVCKNGIKTLRLCSSHITLKMSYWKCGLCLQDLEVIKPASGIRYIRCLNWKECPFFYPEENINGYQHCIYDCVVHEYKVCEGGKPLKCKHMDTCTLRVSRWVNNPFRPYFTCRNVQILSMVWWNTCGYLLWKGTSSLQPRRNCKGGNNTKAQTHETICKKR